MKKKEEKVLCIHHNDADGRLSAAIVLRKYPAAHLVEVNYNNYKDRLKAFLDGGLNSKYDKVFLVDFSMEEKEMQIMIQNSTLIWCDHHKSAMEKLPKIWNDTKLLGERSMDMCGAKLIANYFGFFWTTAINLVDDYDRWEHKLGLDTHYFAEVNKDWTVEEWGFIMCGGSPEIYSHLHEGKKLYGLKLKRVHKQYCKGRKVDFMGMMAYIVNNSVSTDIALLGNDICLEGYDIAIQFSYEGDKVIVHLHSIGKLDVSKIAKEHGGGGHKNAAGFVLSIDEFTAFFNLRLR